MITTIFESRPKARKEYSCNACDFLFNTEISELCLTFSELRSCVLAKQNKYKIKKGEKYVRQFNTDGSDGWTFRAIPAIHKICIKHEIYQE